MTKPSFHAHKCPRCGTVWQHDFDAIPSGKREEAHTCPAEGCGGMQFTKFFGADPAGYCHNGARTVSLTEKTNVEQNT